MALTPLLCVRTCCSINIWPVHTSQDASAFLQAECFLCNLHLLLRAQLGKRTAHLAQGGHGSGSEGWDADSECGVDAIAVSQQGSLGGLSDAGAAAAAAATASSVTALRTRVLSAVDMPCPDIGVCRCASFVGMCRETVRAQALPTQL